MEIILSVFCHLEIISSVFTGSVCVSSRPVHKEMDCRLHSVRSDHPFSLYLHGGVWL